MMPTSPSSVVIQHLLADLRPDPDGMTDGELVARFVGSRDGDALATLVRRHAPMVWGVCRRLLDHHDAEDAFQATFLVLVRKVADVPRHVVANWLYGVARQTAVRLRATAAKRGRRETQVVNMPEPTVPTVHDADMPVVLDEELSRLPEHYRGVIVLCDLEGMTRKAAAQQLGIPEGSVASRLARARALLAKRLAQRGIVFSGSLAAVLSAGSVSAFAPPALVTSTIQAASLLAAGQAAGGVSAKVAALTEGVVKAMFVTRIKSVLAVLLVVGLGVGGIGLGVGLSTNPVAVAQEKTPDKAPAKVEQPALKKDQKQGEEKQAMGKEEQLRVLIDKVLAAHGGEEKLSNLKFTETVKQTQDGKVTTIDYFVHPPDHFRAELQYEGQATKEIHLVKKDFKQWRKHPNGKVEEIKRLGADMPIAYTLDHVRFFGPRLVLRLKDADHRLSLLDEVKIGGRPAIGVELKKEVPSFKLSLRFFFDKETNLLVKQENVLSTFAVSYSDYKKFDGIPIARKVAQTVDGKVIIATEVTDFRAVDKFDAKLFEQP